MDLQILFPTPRHTGPRALPRLFVATGIARPGVLPFVAGAVAHVQSGRVTFMKSFVSFRRQADGTARWTLLFRLAPDAPPGAYRLHAYGFSGAEFPPRPVEAEPVTFDIAEEKGEAARGVPEVYGAPDVTYPNGHEVDDMGRMAFTAWGSMNGTSVDYAKVEGSGINRQEAQQPITEVQNTWIAQFDDLHPIPSGTQPPHPRTFTVRNANGDSAVTNFTVTS